MRLWHPTVGATRRDQKASSVNKLVKAATAVDVDWKEGIGVKGHKVSRQSQSYQVFVCAWLGEWVSHDTDGYPNTTHDGDLSQSKIEMDVPAQSCPIMESGCLSITMADGVD